MLLFPDYFLPHTQLNLIFFKYYSSGKSKKYSLNPGSAKAEYDLAAELGLATCSTK
jgi:hypothetical protein